MKKICLGVLLIRRASRGLDGKMEHMVELLNKVPEVTHMREDQDTTMKDARELCIGLSEHECGEPGGLSKLDMSMIMGLSRLYSPEVPRAEDYDM